MYLKKKGSGFWKSSKNWTTSRTRLHERLRSNKTMFLAVSVPHADHPFFAQLMKHMSAEALKHQYKVIVFQTFYQKQNELKVLEPAQEERSRRRYAMQP